MLCIAIRAAEIANMSVVAKRPGAGIHVTNANNSAVARRHVHTRPANVSRITSGNSGTASLKLDSAIPAAIDKSLSGDMTNTISASARHSDAMLRLH